ncbi:LOW QUALITY PROTEIN: ras and Rab interactor 3-like [Austrofundulus limnaeus]|uniref:LOW QUALITY PROTEIN: ras and Rab interactor 3-like n=1 Tax=Austrofundulus limnaeus TaxID=52670 RepID=A0A2I4CR22_AUSLI|nr:PREDICTED: LOW QUALITY PROTEIN: ras and Rab interactor 3-like [Austrofundulus limnaeus]
MSKEHRIRDILPISLRLPQAVNKATKKEELEVISALGADFWASDVNQKDRDVPVQPDTYLYINPVAVEEQPNKNPNLASSTSRANPINSKIIASSLQNGEPSKKPSMQGKGPTQTSLEAPEPERNEERGEKDEKKPTSPPPSRPPVPLQARAAPPLPPAPLHRTSSSSRKSSVKENIFKLISFYCVSRDILPISLRLPQAVNKATKKEELEVISALGADFWASDVNQKDRDVPVQPDTYLYINPVAVEEQPNKNPNLASSTSRANPINSKIIASSLQNGEPSKKPSMQGKGPTQTSLEAPEPERNEERGEKDEKKPTSPPPSRPPVPLQARAAPPLPPAPLHRTSSSSRKSSVKENLLGEKAGQETSRRDEVDLKAVKEDKLKSQGPLLVKKPSRPIPPPRTKPANSPVCSSQVGGGASTNQSAETKPPPPSPRRPDVSLYSPQGGGALGPNQDPCSTSSTEEEGETNQEQETNNRTPTESRSSKPIVKRTPTVMLDRARHRLSTVLTGLIYHDGRLTKRIAELARDPMSYFGNLVKHHRAFTLETMSNHLTSTELLQEIRQMMTQLKSYLLQSTELQVIMEPKHQYTQDKLESIIVGALCKSVLKPLKEPIYKSLEKLHVCTGSMEMLAQNQSVVLGSTTTALGITTAVPEAPAIEKISIKLNKLHQEYSPQKKIELLLKTCKIIYNSMSISSPRRVHGVDDFLPVMMDVLARSNLYALQLDVMNYMMELMDPALTLGEGSYYLTTTYGTLEHIKTFNQQRSAMRQLSREIQDSIHRWERRCTLNQEREAQGSVWDFLTVYCPEIGENPKTLGVFSSMTIQQLSEQCVARFEQDSYMLSVYMDNIYQPIKPTDLALGVKNSCQPGVYCFVYHPIGQSIVQPVRTCPAAPSASSTASSTASTCRNPPPSQGLLTGLYHD